MLCAVVALGSAGCTQQEVDQLGEALFRILLFIVAIVLLMAVLFALGVFLLATGLARRSWPRAAIGGFVMLLATLPIWVPRLPWRDEPRRTTTTVVQPDDPRVSLADECNTTDNKRRCERAADVARRLVYDSIVGSIGIGPLRVELQPDGRVRANVNLATTSADTSFLTHGLVDEFEDAGWSWRNRPPCPPDRPPISCEAEFHAGRDESLTLEFASPPNSQAKLEVTPTRAGTVVVAGWIVMS